jgi:hypothetical protein
VPGLWNCDARCVTPAKDRGVQVNGQSKPHTSVFKLSREAYETDLLGDAYCSVGIESNAKLILAWHLGRRGAHDARIFAEKMRATLFADRATRMGSSLHFP